MSKVNIKKVEKAMIFGEIHLIVYDFDGVMTDNRVLSFQDGTEAVWANRSDGLGINMIKKLGIPQIIISTESNSVVERRAEKVGLPVMYNVSDKHYTLTEYANKNHFDINHTIFVGNDINDLQAMQTVGYPIAPADAHDKIQKIAKLTLTSKGGYGVIRELADLLQSKK